jgi:Arm DNA-binding domain
VLRIRYDGERIRLTLGHWPSMSLVDARAEARRLRDMASQGIDPRRARNARRGRSASSCGTASKHTIGHLADEFSERYIRVNRKRPNAQKIAEFTLHDLRRTVRTGLARLGVLPHIAERISSHRQPGVIGVCDRYQYLEERREALEKWAAHVEGLKAKKD